MYSDRFKTETVMGRVYRPDIRIQDPDIYISQSDVRDRRSRQSATMHNIFTAEKYLGDTLPKTNYICSNIKVITSIPREEEERLKTEYNLVFDDINKRWTGDNNEVFIHLSEKYYMPEIFHNWNELFIAFKYGAAPCTKKEE